MRESVDHGGGLATERISTWAPDLVEAIRAHYTGSRGAPPPGKKMAVRITEDGRVVAYYGIGEPSYKLAPRRRLGLMDARPLPHTVGNWLYRRVGRGSAKGSVIIRAAEAHLGAAWRERYGWHPTHWETLVLPSAVQSRVPGAAYRRAGYRTLGFTTGRGARRPPGATHAARVWGDTAPKLVLYRGPLPRRFSLACCCKSL